jgi:F-type H+-transporting ATPase subunit a
MMKIVRLLFIVFMAVNFSVSAFANESKDSASTATKEKFDAGKLIMHHIGDAYEWHMATLGHVHLSIPLPVILYSETKGFKIFMSSKFHHGTEAYDGFQIAHHGKYEGKIIEMTANGEEIRPWDFSITKNVMSLFCGLAILLLIFLSIAKRYKENWARAPKGLQSWVEPLILFVRDNIAKPSIGKEYARFLPYLLTIFFFIFINNLLGLIPFFPGGANLTGNIAITMVMAVFTFAITSFNGTKDYWLHIVNTPGVPWWLKLPLPLMPIVEIMGVFIKPFVLMVRLFANITAGHIIVLAFCSLIFIFGEISPIAGYGVSIVSVAFSIFMGLLELLVAFIQAYVFTLLSALYFGMALVRHNHAEHH